MKKRLTQEEVIARFREVHGDRYDYSKTEYKNMNEKVCIICPIHGEFWQTPQTHLKSGCPKCGAASCSKKLSKGRDGFIKDSIMAHGYKYDYSKVEYIDAHTKVCIICPEHGEFWQIPTNHISKKMGCPKCGVIKRAKSQMKKKDTFIKEAIAVHGNMYDYSKVDYKGANAKVCIICPIHGEFWQRASHHVKHKNGCPYCSASKGEKSIKSYFTKRNIEFIPQYKIQIQEMSMFGINKPKIDFFLPQYNTFVEFNGIQHYEYNPFFHENEEDFQKQLDRDKRLRQYCKQRGINLIEIKYNQIDKIDKILDKKLKH